MRPDAEGAGREPILEVRDLEVEFRLGLATTHAVRGVSFNAYSGETLAVLGESGSGKSVCFEAVLGILQSPPGHVIGGEVRYRGRSLFDLPPRERRRLCGRRIAMIFQDPLSALNPVFSVGWQIAEMLRVHEGLPRAEADRRAVALMERVGIPAARERAADFPHQFSGGMRQRIIIAMALAADPEIIIADEPTTALDATVQAQILDLLRTLIAERNICLIMITHSMGVVAEIADRVLVFYAGQVVETGPIAEVFARPAHPYTRALLDSVPRLGDGSARMVTIGGQPPALTSIRPGCAFAPRCPRVREVCRNAETALTGFAGGARGSACHFYSEMLRGETAGVE